MDMCIPIRRAHKHKTLGCHCTWWSCLGRTEPRHASISPWTCVGVVHISVPCPPWVDGGAGYPGQGLAQSSLCRSQPVWVCLNGTILAHTYSVWILNVPVHLNNERLHFIFYMLLRNPALMWLFFCHVLLFFSFFFLHSASPVMYFVMMNY